MIRCDGHGMYFGPLMEKHDPLVLRQPIPQSELAPHTWMRGGTHYYFYSRYSDPTFITVPTVEGFEITKLWDVNPRVAESAARVFYNKPTICKSFEQVSDDVDMVFISDCNLNGEDHVEFAAPGLKKGVATFVDKPFAPTVGDIQKLYSMADASGAPLISLSIMRMAPAGKAFAQRFTELGVCDFATIQGYGDELNHLTHPISLAQNIFGDGIREVSCTPGKPMRSIHLSWGDRSDRPVNGVTINNNTGALLHGGATVSAFGPRGVIHSVPFGDWEHPYGAAKILEVVREMLQTRKVPIARSEMTEVIAVAQAAYRSNETGKLVQVQDILDSSKR